MSNLFFLPNMFLRRILTATVIKQPCSFCIRQQSYATRKRFYRGTGVIQSENQWGVLLDHRRLKTPSGKVLTVDSEPLARAIAAEWDAQTDVITLATMHLTSLCNTAQDNPGKLTRHDIVNHILDCLPTDTLLYQADEEEPELMDVQQKKWGPVLEWFRKRFDVKLDVASGLEPPIIATGTRATLAKYFLSFDFASIQAVYFGMEALKSPVLMVACVERYLDAKDAVFLARLEEEYQLVRWGRVPWAHEVNQADLTSRVAAALLLIQGSTESHYVKTKSNAKGTDAV